MGRAVVRVIIGLLMALAVGLMFAPILWPASAQSPDRIASGPAQLPTVTTRVTTPPSSSSVSTTPTSRKPTGTTRPRVTATTTTTTPPSTTTTSTTVAPIPAPAPAPVTLPLASAAQSGSIGAFFPILSAIGIVTLIGLLTAQWFLTKPGRKGPTL
ncbi:MAG: hypothetical protein QOF81_1180 [Acidimicrobiaceae bacterium]|jgi:cytoskeletal protein RodZ|nr:hypothetical protein [Acidimicrobiaceae bacterium]